MIIDWEEEKRQYVRNLYIISLFKKKRDKRREYARKKYMNLSKAEKDKKRQCACE